MNMFLEVLLFQLKSDILFLKYKIVLLSKNLLNYFLDRNKYTRRWEGPFIQSSSEQGSHWMKTAEKLKFVRDIVLECRYACHWSAEKSDLDYSSLITYFIHR